MHESNSWEAIVLAVGAIIAQVAFIMAIARGVSGSQGGALVISQWSATTTPADAEGTYVTVVARPEGVSSWIASLVGLQRIVDWRITASSVVIEVRSLSGYERRIIPIRHVTCIETGYARPWMAAAGIAFVVMSAGIGLERAVDLGALATVSLILVGLAVAAVYYFLNRTFFLGVREGTRESRIYFKRSVIENQEINEKQAHAVVSIVRSLVDAAP